MLAMGFLLHRCQGFQWLLCICSPPPCSTPLLCIHLHMLREGSIEDGGREGRKDPEGGWEGED